MPSTAVVGGVVLNTVLQTDEVCSCWDDDSIANQYMIEGQMDTTAKHMFKVADYSGWENTMLTYYRQHIANKHGGSNVADDTIYPG